MSINELNVDFDLGEVEEQTFQTLPAGKYRAIITGVEFRDGYGGDGKTLWVKMRCLDEPVQNRSVTAFLDTHSSVDWKQASGRRMVKALATILDISDLKDFGQLVTTAPIGIEIKNYKTKSGETREQVKAFLPADDVPVVDPSDTDDGLAF